MNESLPLADAESLAPHARRTRALRLALAAALTVGRSDDLQAARRLIASGADIGDRAGEFGDLASDLDSI